MYFGRQRLRGYRRLALSKAARMLEMSGMSPAQQKQAAHVRPFPLCKLVERDEDSFSIQLHYKLEIDDLEFHADAQQQAAGPTTARNINSKDEEM